VGSQANLEAIFKAAREKYGDKLMLAIHHYGTYRVLK
jgi:hypothetical protein